jgi:hypothetical protein
MLKHVHAAPRVAEGGSVDVFGFAYPTRSVIGRLSDGRLWIWSPVKLFDELRAEVDRLGPAHGGWAAKTVHRFLAQSLR